MTAVITVMTTALLATVIFVLVQIAVCKCHPKFTTGGAEPAPSAGGEGPPVYEEVDVGKGDRNDPTYMEVGAGNAMKFEQNEAYGTAYFGSQ